jgi:UDP-N-acetylmuramate: L-alanyl-gamma-D-glutamyl-meso-diaminopimelate ligase
VGARVEGFETMVRLSTTAPVMILEGDEYLSSPIDRRPKFHLYHADIALISGIAWDHINVFPTFEEYVHQFQVFADMVPDTGILVYCENDSEVKKVAAETTSGCKKIPYGIPKFTIRNGQTFLAESAGSLSTPLNIFGDHNLMNLEGARLVCKELGVGDREFLDAISSFKGAARRLELLSENENTAVFKDFAHSPSKLKATTEAVKKQFPKRKLVACMELHTFSSLNENFLAEYNKSMSEADVPIVYYNPHTIEHKRLKPITTEQVKKAFGDERILVFTNSEELKNYLLHEVFDNSVLLMMSSGTFDGLKLEQLAKEITDTE